MLARILSSVLLPDPLRPTMPKNSPCRTSKDTPRRACSTRYWGRASGWTTRSLNESMRWIGILKAFSTPSTSMTTGALDIGSRLLTRREAAPELVQASSREADVVTQVLAPGKKGRADRDAAVPQEEEGGQHRRGDV